MRPEPLPSPFLFQWCVKTSAAPDSWQTCADLREWARRELDGYVGAGDQVPEYREIVAPIVIDGFTPRGHIERQPFNPLDLPQFVQDSGISESLSLRDGVGTLETMRADGLAKGEAIRMGLPDGSIIAKVMNHELQSTGQ
jgi:hypothetical protein